MLMILFVASVVAVSIGNAQYSYPEGSGSHLIPIEMNRPVARGFTIRVFGGASIKKKLFIL